ncbi:MAG: thioredoxin [Saprospiraceae bacterium]|nr:thioredoxin [Saprospiraceae bacterium]
MTTTDSVKTFSELLESEQLVLVDFYATWCGPCKMMQPVIQNLKSKVGNAARILKVDVDKNPAVMRQYNISGVPTFILFKKGQIVWRQSGAMSEQALIEAIFANQ